MKIKVASNTVYKGVRYPFGTTIELEDAIAESWIEKGLGLRVETQETALKGEESTTEGKDSGAQETALKTAHTGVKKRGRKRKSVNSK